MTEQSSGCANDLGRGYRPLRSGIVSLHRRQVSVLGKKATNWTDSRAPLGGPRKQFHTEENAALTIKPRDPVPCDRIRLGLIMRMAPHLPEVIQPRCLILRVDDHIPTITFGCSIGDSFGSAYKDSRRRRGRQRSAIPARSASYH
jgi:hypothetical protein